MNNCSIPSMHAERKITVCSHRHSFTPDPSLSPYRWTEKQIHLLCMGWRNFFPVVVLCQFWLWWEIVLDVTYLPYQLCHCVFFWLWWEIFLGCTDRSVFLLWQENQKQSAQTFCGASSRQISDNRLSCQNTNTTNHTLI
jgi:hypothetical protein